MQCGNDWPTLPLLCGKTLHFPEQWHQESKMTPNDNGHCRGTAALLEVNQMLFNTRNLAHPRARDPDSSNSEVLWPVVSVSYSTSFNRSYMKLVVANGTNPRYNMCHWLNNNRGESRIMGGRYITIWTSFLLKPCLSDYPFLSLLEPCSKTSSFCNENGRKKGSSKDNLAHMV